MAQKERIVSAAFAAWGDTHFTDTSLSLVASRLGVTKQAIYRHVSGKGELLSEMERQFAADMHRVVDDFESEALSRPLTGAVRSYIELLFGFFRDHPYYYLYLTLHLVRFPAHHGQAFKQVRDRHRRLLADLLASAGFTDARTRGIAAHFLSMTGFLWMASCFWTADGHRRTIKAGDKGRYQEEMEARRKLAVDIVLRGLFPDTPLSVDFSRVESRAAVDATELPERDRILDAIADVVSAEGFEQATVEKIAERAGMSKSSLYFHFRNRSQMMASILVPERERLIALVEDRISEYADFAHRLYAFMVVTATYAAQSSTILTALDWMRFHRIRVHFGGTREQRPVFTFLEEALSREGYAHAGLNSTEVSAYLHHLVMRPILEGRTEAGGSLENMLESVRLLYQFVVGGLVGKENEG